MESEGDARITPQKKGREIHNQYLEVVKEKWSEGM